MPPCAGRLASWCGSAGHFNYQGRGLESSGAKESALFDVWSKAALLGLVFLSMMEA